MCVAESVPTPLNLRRQKLNRCSLACNQVRKVAEEALSESAGPSLLLILGKSGLRWN